MSEGLDPASKRQQRLVLALTLARIPLSIGFAALFTLAADTTVRMIAGLAILLSIEVSDICDGMLARRWSVVSEWGAMLDPFADSFSRLTVFWGLAVAGIALAPVPLVMALRDVTVAYSRVTLAKHQKTVAAKMSGKIKAVVQGTAGMCLVGGPIYHWLIGSWTQPALSWIVMAVTAWSAVAYVRAAVQAHNEP